MLIKTKRLLTASAFAVALAGGAQAATLGMFEHDYGSDAGKVAPTSYGVGNLNGDSVTVSDDESPRFGDAFDISGVVGTISEFVLTLTFSGAGPSWVPLEVWTARVFGSDDSSIWDDAYVLLDDSQSSQSMSFSLGTDNLFTDAFAHSVATGEFFFGFSEWTPDTDAFDLKSAKLTVNSAPSVVPLPAALPLLFVALGGLGFAARRRKA